jgi:putative cell wall-binding protein
VALSRGVHAANSVTTVYLATGTAYPDGLSAGPVAGTQFAPLLLVRPNAVPGVVADELRRLDPTNIVFVGGTGAISDGVRNAIRAIWP